MPVTVMAILVFGALLFGAGVVVYHYPYLLALILCIPGIAIIVHSK